MNADVSHLPMSVRDRVFSALGGPPSYLRSVVYHRNRNPFLVGYQAEPDDSMMRSRLARLLDEWDWALVTLTGNTCPESAPADAPRGLSFFVVAELVPLRPGQLERRGHKLYHAAPRSRIAAIREQGLLPGSPERSKTSYPDTNDKIHVSEWRAPQEHIGDPLHSAACWCERLTAELGEEHVVLTVDVKDLPAPGRIVRDTHSDYGIVIDRVQRIEPERIQFPET